MGKFFAGHFVVLVGVHGSQITNRSAKVILQPECAEIHMPGSYQQIFLVLIGL